MNANEQFANADLNVYYKIQDCINVFMEIIEKSIQFSSAKIKESSRSVQSVIRSEIRLLESNLNRGGMNTAKAIVKRTSKSLVPFINRKFDESNMRIFRNFDSDFVSIRELAGGIRESVYEMGKGREERVVEAFKQNLLIQLKMLNSSVKADIIGKINNMGIDNFNLKGILIKDLTPLLKDVVTEVE